MMCFVQGELVPQPLESHVWDGSNVGSCVVEYVGVGSLDLYGGLRSSTLKRLGVILWVPTILYKTVYIQETPSVVSNDNYNILCMFFFFFSFRRASCVYSMDNRFLVFCIHLWSEIIKLYANTCLLAWHYSTLWLSSVFIFSI